MSWMSRRIPALGALALLTAALPQDAHAGQWSHARNGFTIGFNLGVGSAGVDLDDGGSSDRASGGAGSLRIGYAVSPQLVVGFDGNGWTNETDGVEQTFSMGGVGMTWYPQQGGLWLKAIVGAGRAEFRTRFLGADLEVADTGAALAVGTGYEWRLTRSFALGPAMDLARASFDGGSADWANVSLGLNWYL
jgi:hypothetical protein